MKFEFDPNKSTRTKADPNRGIDFHEAKELWSDPNRLEIPLPSTDEARFQLLAMMRGKHWSAIFTHRRETLRIISHGRMRHDETKIYNQSDRD